MSTGLSAIILEIESDIRNIEDEAGLLMPLNFNARSDALDFIDFHIIDRINGLMESSGEHCLLALKQRAGLIKSKLDNVNTQLFEGLRTKIKAGECKGRAFIDMVSEHLGSDAPRSVNDNIGYDNLDIFVNGLLDDHAMPEPVNELEPDMVFYQKTPARIVFELADIAQLDSEDIFYDLGSGLGQVAILINLITGVKTIGIEYDPAYCDYATLRTRQHNLTDVEFINADVRNADYADGTVFFMYTPFGGQMLDDVLTRLRTAAVTHPIHLFAYGPCSAEIAKQKWLGHLNGEPKNHYSLCYFSSLPGL